MKELKDTFKYEMPTERQIFEMYERHNRAYNRSDARKMKRALRRLALY